MKLFEQIWHKEFETDPKYEYSSVAMRCKVIAKIYWRFALQCIRDQMDQNKFMDNGELRTFIEKELDNE